MPNAPILTPFNHAVITALFATVCVLALWAILSISNDDSNDD